MEARLWFFGPVLVWAAGLGLIRAEIFGVDVGEDEVLGWHGAAGEAAQESELAGVGHGVGEGALEEDFGGDAVELCAAIDVVSYVGEYLVEVRDGGGEIREGRRLVGAAEEVGAGVAEDAVHVADKFVRGANLRCGAEVGEFGRGAAERFLRPVGEGGEEVLEEGSLFVHAFSFTRFRVVSSMDGEDRRYGITAGTPTAPLAQCANDAAQDDRVWCAGRKTDNGQKQIPTG